MRVELGVRLFTNIEMNMKASVRIVFAIFLFSLVLSVAAGLVLLWNPSLSSEFFGRMIATSVIIMLASGFYIAVCDALIRIRSDQDRLQ